MISDLTKENHIVQNIKKYSNKPRNSLISASLEIEGTALIPRSRETSQKPKKFDPKTKKQTAVKYQETFNYASLNLDSSAKSFRNKISAGIRRTNLKNKIVNEIASLRSEPKIDDSNHIILRNFRKCGEYKKITYYTYRKVFQVPVTTIPNDLLRISDRRHQSETSAEKTVKNTNKVKILSLQNEAINEHNKVKISEKFERLRKEKMEFSKGNRRDVDRSNLTPENSSIETSNGLNDNHQLLTVSDKDKNYSDFIDDKKRVCSNIECKTFLGEAIRNRKLSKDYQIEKTQSTPENETSDEYLQDSYNYVFQRHVDHLTTVISQHMNSTQPATSDKTKTQVHIRPTENFAKNDNSDVKISRKPSPKSKKKILTKLEIKAAAVETTEPKTVKFAEEEISSEGEMRVIKEKLEEANIFEELNNNETSDRKPMIVFNHVSTETKPEKISYQVINKAGSRSPSPLLEVPSLEFKAEPMRPPL